MLHHSSRHTIHRASGKANQFTRNHVVHEAWQCSDRILNVLDEFSEQLGLYTEQTGDITTARRLGKWTHTIRSSIDNQEVEQSLIALSTCLDNE